MHLSQSWGDLKKRHKREQPPLSVTLHERINKQKQMFTSHSSEAKLGYVRDKKLQCEYADYG